MSDTPTGFFAYNSQLVSSPFYQFPLNRAKFTPLRMPSPSTTSPSKSRMMRIVQTESLDLRCPHWLMP